MKSGGYSLALDLGTTTLGGSLLDGQGSVLGLARRANPQTELGADVISRLERARDGEAGRLQSLLLHGVETLAGELLNSAGLNRSDLASVCVAANPAICHLLLKLPADSILFPPHRPAERFGRAFSCRELGLDLDAPVYIFPLVSGYVGGDLVAFLYSQPEPAPGTLYVDIGTNGEMALFTESGWLVTSVAAGPAFEGGGISCGMTLSDGAVTAVRRDGERLRLEVAGGGSPRGICGSGLVSAIGAALESGLLGGDGTIADPMQVETNLARHIAETERGRSLRLYRDASIDLLLTQGDIRNFQLAKGALRAGVVCLLQRAGIEPEELVEVVMTGAFGLSLGPEELKGVALLPEKMVDKLGFVEGGALRGCQRFLQQPRAAEQVAELAARLKPYPLSGTPAFEKSFLASLDF